MTGSGPEEFEAELAAAYRHASENASALAEEWNGTSKEAWGELE